VQPGVDEAGGAADVGGDQVVELSRFAPVQVRAQAVGLDAPQPEQGPGRDLRLGLVCAHPGPFGQDLGGHRDELIHHVALVGAQRRGGPDQVAEPADLRGGAGGVVVAPKPVR